MNQNSLKELKRVGMAVAAAIVFVAGCSGGSSSDSSTASSTPPAGAPASASASSGGGSGSWAGASAIFTANCAPCHSGARPKAGLDLSSYDGLMKGSMQGPAVVAGKPDDSLIVKAITGAPGLRKMPPRGALQQSDIDSIKAWIQAGAKQS